jgi:transposase
LSGNVVGNRTRRGGIMHHYLQSTKVPEKTARIARKVFRKGNPYMTLRDNLGVIFRDESFKELFSYRGRRAESPGNLALVLVMQYMEGLTDRQAADAVRARIDWKYALGLELEDEGFDGSLLSTFRQRVVKGEKEEEILTRILEVAAAQDLLQTEQQRTDSTHVIGAIRQLNRVELVGETLRAALEAVAEVDPEWLSGWLPADWVELYGQRLIEYRLPDKEKERQALVLQIGADGRELMQRVAADRPEWAGLEALAVLGKIWEQQYVEVEGRLAWRPGSELPPPRERLNSPFDVAARAARKRQTQWIGYKVHLTETCDEAFPYLVTQVQTSQSTELDHDALPAIQERLAERNMQPKQQLVDAGYVSATTLTDSKLRHIELLGPLQLDTSWQAREPDGYHLACFKIDWQRQQVTCPQGHTSQSWTKKNDRQKRRSAIIVRFPKSLCDTCSARQRCTRAKTRGRAVTFQSQSMQEAIDQARSRQQHPHFAAIYRRREGIEATISQGVRCFHLRQARYRGRKKVHLQNLLIASAMNLTRIIAWLQKPAHLSRPPGRLKNLPLAA